MGKKVFIKVCGKDVEIQGKLIRIARLDGEEFVSFDKPEVLLKSLQKSGTRVDLFTFLQRPPETAPRYNYPVEWDNLAVLPVSTFDHWWTRQIQSNVRVKVRKAEKNKIIVREVPFDDALLQGICEIYNETHMRQGTRFPHYGMKLERMREYAGTFLDRSIFFGAFLGESMIGFAKVVVDKTRMQATLLHILSMVQHRDKAPTNALIAQVVRSCAEDGMAYLTYGNLVYGKKQGDSLSRFKAANGFQCIDLPRYYLPLSHIGWASFRLGLHHRLVDLLPETVATKLRDFRKAWYSRKFQRVKEE
jgi:hypothetical protein